MRPAGGGNGAWMPLVYAMGIAAVFGYGASSFLTKIAVTGADSLAVGMLRAIVATPVALALIALLRLRVPWRGRAGRLLLISGIGGLALFPILFSLGLRQTTAGHATTASACGAVVAGIIMALVERRWPSRSWWAGIVVGLSGAVLLIWEAIGLAVEGVTWQGDMLVFVGMVVGVGGYVAGARLAHEVGAVAVTMWSTVVAGVLLVPAVALYADGEMLASIPAESWMATATLAWGGNHRRLCTLDACACRWRDRAHRCAAIAAAGVRNPASGGCTRRTADAAARRRDTDRHCRRRAGAAVALSAGVQITMRSDGGRSAGRRPSSVSRIAARQPASTARSVTAPSEMRTAGGAGSGPTANASIGASR
jgi:drug/metabolite transporter (DMT)-like permease